MGSYLGASSAEYSAWALFKGLILSAIECCMCLEIQQHKVVRDYCSFSNL